MTRSSSCVMTLFKQHHETVFKHHETVFKHSHDTEFAGTMTVVCKHSHDTIQALWQAQVSDIVQGPGRVGGEHTGQGGE
jgi:hypothetical protein